MKNFWKVTHIPKDFPPMLRRKATIGVWHFIAIGVLFLVIVVTAEYPRTEFSPFKKIVDFALLLQGIYVVLLTVWFIVTSLWCAKVANGVLKKGGTACIYCGYQMDPSASVGACPECGQLYNREHAVARWSAVWPQRARRLLGPKAAQTDALNGRKRRIS
jgi:hypothetical protein